MIRVMSGCDDGDAAADADDDDADADDAAADALRAAADAAAGGERTRLAAELLAAASAALEFHMVQQFSGLSHHGLRVDCRRLQNGSTAHV